MQTCHKMEKYYDHLPPWEKCCVEGEKIQYNLLDKNGNENMFLCLAKQSVHLFMFCLEYGVN